MTAARPDLMHLSPEALAQVTNVGVVKRAVRELEGGYRPMLALDADGTLAATFSDGLVTTWPQGKPIQQAHCSCGATTVCRHRIITALAFRESAAPPADEPAATVASPGETTDAALAALIPASLMQLAAQQRDQGLGVDVRRAASGEPCDTARLPSATVRFWAGAAIEAARCDCLRAAACEHVALGVWAFRQADAVDASSPALQVRLGEAGSRTALDTAPHHALVEALVRHGVSQGVAPLVVALSGAVDAARRMGAVWLDHLLADTERWAAAYAARSALYEPEHGVALLSELALRLAAGPLPGRAMAVLGMGQAQETELDRLRLVCLGARTQRDGEQRRTRLVMADTDTGTRMVITKEWSVPEAQLPQEATLRASERLAPGVRLEQLAQGQLLAQQARRLADGSLRLAKARSSQNSVLPQGADWSQLGAPLRFASVDQLVAHQRAHPTAALQPRHAAGQFVVYTPASVAGLAFDPNTQALIGVLNDAQDQPVVVRRHHEQHTRHALDAIAGAFDGRFGPLRHVAGLLRWDHGTPVIEPWALACDRVVVPDFAGEACGALAGVPIGHDPAATDAEPLGQALSQLRTQAGTLLHHGLSRLPRHWVPEAMALSKRLEALSLHVLAQRLAGVAAQVQAGCAQPAEAGVAPGLLTLLALVQLHEDAVAVAVAGK